MSHLHSREKYGIINREACREGLEAVISGLCC